MFQAPFSEGNAGRELAAPVRFDQRRFRRFPSTPKPFQLQPRASAAGLRPAATRWVESDR